MYIFLSCRTKKLKIKSKFIKFIKYIIIIKLDVKVNFEALLSLVCIFLFFFYTQKKKFGRKTTFSTKFVIQSKLIWQNKAFF